MREIARHFRIPSTRTVTDLLRSLETKGYVQRTAGRSRGVILKGFAGGAGTQPVPIVRFARDGRMITEGHLTLDRSFLPSDEALLVHASGEDAPAHAVREGDLLLVHPGARAGEDAPIVVRVGISILVRVVQHRGATLVLKAPSTLSRDLVLGPDEGFRVLGPLAGVIRKTIPRPDDEPDALSG